jgi:lipoprotein-anchoring transpeptidase ErfK/SrfK
MKRAALVAGVSIAAILGAGPTESLAWTGNAGLWGSTVAASPPVPPRSIRKRSRPADKADARKAGRTPDKTPIIPPGPLHIIVSIDKQRATLFADGMAVASTAISSGTASHPTPMGVFSIIQKSRHHVSNLYNAPMPYMQRITWSGSALHQGALPGYPASHGCVRLTDSFAELLWKTTKMGARVIITRPEVAPFVIEHARLFVPTPKVAVAPKPAEPPAKAAEATRISVPAPEPATTGALAKVKTADASNSTTIAVLSVTGDDSKPVATSVVTEPTANEPSAEQPTKVSATDGAGGTPEPTPQAAAPIEDQTAAIKTVEATPIEITPAATVAAPAPIIVDERPPAMPAAIVREANGRPISVFASLREGKLYVRQGWKPLFDAPVSFERPDQPIGTHVYTAMAVKSEGNGLRWTVVTIPSSTKRGADIKVADKDLGRRSRNDRTVKTIEVEAPLPSASTALDRIVMPPELVERISELITPGSSLIVSDNKLSDETGEYTDFIVLTR